MTPPTEPLAITAFEPLAGGADPTNVAAQVARRRAALRDRHWTMLVLCAIVVALSFALQLDGGDRVTATNRWPLPVMCGSRALLGVECPGCGLTRSFVALAHGEVRRSLEFHRIGWLMFAAVVGQLVYRPWALYELRTKIVERRWPTWFGSLLISALIGNWLLKMLGV